MEGKKNDVKDSYHFFSTLALELDLSHILFDNGLFLGGSKIHILLRIEPCPKLSSISNDT